MTGYVKTITGVILVEKTWNAVRFINENVENVAAAYVRHMGYIVPNTASHVVASARNLCNVPGNVGDGSVFLVRLRLCVLI